MSQIAHDISSMNGVESIVGLPTPALAEEELTPEMIRWRQLFERWGELETAKSLAFDRMFTSNYAQRCKGCHTAAATAGHSRCKKCLEMQRAYNRRKRREARNG